MGYSQSGSSAAFAAIARSDRALGGLSHFAADVDSVKQVILLGC